MTEINKRDTYVIYHSADYDGIFCREIAKKFLPHVKLIGWDFGQPEPLKAELDGSQDLYIMDLSIPSLMDYPRLVWIDHHASAIVKFSTAIKGYRIDGVSACRLAWQWFNLPRIGGEVSALTKQDFIDRKVSEPEAVRLAGEYDVWDKRDPRAEVFQHGLDCVSLESPIYGQGTSNWWDELLRIPTREERIIMAGPTVVDSLLSFGKSAMACYTKRNADMVRDRSFTMDWEGLKFLCLNTAKCNSATFAAAIRPEHDGLLAFFFDGKMWKASLYGVPGKPDINLSEIAIRHGGGGHKQACGFTSEFLPFIHAKQATNWTGSKEAKNNTEWRITELENAQKHLACAAIENGEISFEEILSIGK